MRECVEKSWLPQALSIGIGYELFWKLNPHKLKSFAEADKIKFKREQETLNLTAWLNGIYVRDAIASSFSKNAKYPNKPIDLTSKEETTSLTDSERFGAWAISFNNQHNDLPED